MHSQPDAPLTFPLPHIKLIPNIHTHSQPNAFRPSLFCIKSIPDVSSVSQSPIVYLPHSMCLSPSFLTLYIYVPLLFHCMFLCHITHYPLLVFYVSSSVPCLRLPLFHLSLFLTSIAPTLVIPYIPYDPFLIVQIIPIITTPRTCINTLSTSCCSSV